MARACARIALVTDNVEAFDLPPISTKGWTSGVYVLRLAADGAAQTRRFTVVR